MHHTQRNPLQANSNLAINIIQPKHTQALCQSETAWGRHRNPSKFLSISTRQADLMRNATVNANEFQTENANANANENEKGQ